MRRLLIGGIAAAALGVTALLPGRVGPASAACDFFCGPAGNGFRHAAEHADEHGIEGLMIAAERVFRP